MYINDLHTDSDSAPEIMSKISVASVRNNVQLFSKDSNKEHKRNFVETVHHPLPSRFSLKDCHSFTFSSLRLTKRKVELQIGLKDYDPQRNRRLLALPPSLPLSTSLSARGLITKAALRRFDFQLYPSLTSAFVMYCILRPVYRISLTVLPLNSVLGD